MYDTANPTELKTIQYEKPVCQFKGSTLKNTKILFKQENSKNMDLLSIGDYFLLLESMPTIRGVYK
jgi:hypothetical protein